VGPPLELTASPVRSSDLADQCALVIELPPHPPNLTPGLARALMRVISKGAVAGDFTDVADTDESEDIASGPS
jgi:hypothetical protein